MCTRKDTLNSREYAEQLKIAKNALQIIEKNKQCADSSSVQKCDCNCHMERLNIEGPYFDLPQLRMICFDYAFAASENFLEHIGFILVDGWDSKGKQSHYINKQKKLSSFSDFEMVEKKYQPNLDYEALEIKWNTILQLINFRDYVGKRNPIKHVHSEKHDVKTQIVSSNTRTMNIDEYEQLVQETRFALTDSDCAEFVKRVEEFINLIHSFIRENKLIFRIFSEYKEGEKIEKRKRLLETFLVDPFAPTLYSSEMAMPVEIKTLL